ncbi:aldehyde dehydrogenase [Rhodotorula paludigena]|uniref:aldehyde dehydrogenase n=1 Tax=Rhodotorula paludigena TaxID=86838 RepID=UPI00316DBCDE
MPSVDSGSSAFLATSPVPGLLNGKPFTSGSGSYDVKDPHDSSKVIHSVSSITVDDVPKVVDVAHKAFKSWKKSSVVERRNIFNKAAMILRERLMEFAQNEHEETTSTVGWAAFDHTLAVESIEEVAAAASNALRGEVATTESHQRAYINRCPFGVVLGIAPWNAPATLSQRAVLQPIMAGNTAILKTSEMSPRTHMYLAEIMQQAGLPDGVLTIVHVAPKDAPAVTEALIAHDAVMKVNFTGSTRVGQIVAQTCGKYLKPVVLELGGKAPAIVCEDANLEHAANAVKFGGLFHSGQICMATQTAIVHEAVADKFLALLTANYPKASNDKDAVLRGLFTETSAKRVKEAIEDAVSKGAQIIAGENKLEGNVIQPCLLKGVTEDMRIYREEMFAPVFSVLTFKDDEKAIFYANDHEYGLAASVFTSDIDRGLRIADEIDSGMVHINGATVHDHPQVPHGGWKRSGFGRFNGIEGIREFTQTKSVTINFPHASYPAPSS